MHRHSSLGPATVLALAIAAALTSASAATVDAKRIQAAANNNSEWVTHGRTYDEQRFSPLKRINTDTVKTLGLAWYFDLDTNRGQEATPLLIDGTLYFTSAWSKVFAVDARTGKEKWRYDPKVAGEKAVDACCDVVNRGVAAWGNNVFVGTLDGRLIALDMASGKVVWSVQTTDPAGRYTITGAPRVINGKVIIGNGGGEMGVRGFVSAYDAQTGKQIWRFYTVPGNPENGFEDPALEKAAKTWSGEWWKYGGGGTVWDAMAYDRDLDLLYIGVGNGSPWNHQIRSQGKGDNLFLSSIVALKPETGAYVWHFQTTPGESWDYTATQPIVLADLTIQGKKRKVLMQAPKNGFFYVLDRTNGEFISGQTYVNVSWATGLDKTGRPIEVPEARYLNEPAMVAPSPVGGHNWYPMAFSPLTGLVYIPAQEGSSVYSHDPNFVMRERGWNIGLAQSSSQKPNPKTIEAASRKPRSGALLAWDPVAQREVWRVQYSRGGNGGTLATAGNLVFQGAIEGTFNAYAADTGKTLWSYDVQNAVIAGPMTYELDGEQYIATMAGIGGVAMGGAMGDRRQRSEFGRLVVFKMGGKAQLPALIDKSAKVLPNLSRADTKGDPAVGKAKYDSICSVCHGAGAVSNTAIPDLRYSRFIVDEAGFKEIVLQGALAPKGMVSFASVLTEQESESVRTWLVQQATLLAQPAR